MSLATDVGAPTSGPSPVPDRPDHRSSPIPTGAMIRTRFMELRRRRGLMIALILVNIGIPTIFLAVSATLHAFDPKNYGPAGGFDTFAHLTVGVLYTFGFIMAAALGATAGSIDLTEGVFRHLVITGRSRLSLYLTRIPAGLAIVLPLVTIGFTIVCVVSVYAAPATLNYNGLRVPAGMSRVELESWAAKNATNFVCTFPFKGSIPVGPMCLRGPGNTSPGNPGEKKPTPAQIRDRAILIADDVYADYSQQLLYPTPSLMVKTGLWILLEATIGFIVGLGLGSLIGQRTVAVVFMIILEIIVTPLALRAQIPHLANLQRMVIGVATAHLQPGRLPLAFGGGGQDYRLTESTTVAVVVIIGWLVVWSALGAWRMMTRDA